MRSAQPRSLFRPGEPSRVPAVLGYSHVLVETDSPISILLSITGGKDLDRFVVWDYVKMRRKIIA